MKFIDWFKDQCDRTDAVGWVSTWFQKKRTGRYPKEELRAVNYWLAVIAKKASKPQKEALKSSFITAWQEFHSLAEDPVFAPNGIESLSSINSIFVVPTIARLKKKVTNSFETGEIEKQDQLAVTRFHSPPAYVEVRQRLTTSFGGDWVQLGVMLSIPCYPEEIEEAHDFCDDWVTMKIEEEVRKISSSRVKNTDKAHVTRVASEKALLPDSKKDEGKLDIKTDNLAEKKETVDKDGPSFALEHPVKEGDFGI